MIAQQQDMQFRAGNIGGVAATLYTLFLPLNYNDGSLIGQARLDWVQREILRYARGLTRFPPSEGRWLDQVAKVYSDWVVPIQTVAPAGAETTAWFARFAAETAVMLEQHQIFIFAQPVWLLEAPPLKSLFSKE